MVYFTCEIGDKFKQIRKYYNYTITSVAKSTGISEETIRRIEKGQFEPRLSTLAILTEFYKIDLIEFVGVSRMQESRVTDENLMRLDKFVLQHKYLGLEEYVDLEMQLLDIHQEMVYFEAFLATINPNFRNDSMSYPVHLEVSGTIYLSILYRQMNRLDDSEALLRQIIFRINKMPHINNRFLDYLTISYLNLIYVLQCKGNNHLVIQMFDEILSNSKMLLNGVRLSHFHFRKGIALFRLKDPDYPYYLRLSLSEMPIEFRDQTKLLLQEQYEIIIEKRYPKC